MGTWKRSRLRRGRLGHNGFSLECSSSCRLRRNSSCRLCGRSFRGWRSSINNGTRRMAMHRKSTGGKLRNAWHGSARRMVFGRGRGWKRSTRRRTRSCRWLGMQRQWRNRWNECSRARQDRRPKRRTAPFGKLSAGRNGCAANTALRDDDAGLLALELGRLGELVAKEFDETTRARAAVGAQQAHAIEKNQQMKNVRVFEAGRAGTFGVRFLDLVDESNECGVELARQRRVRQFFVDDA